MTEHFDELLRAGGLRQHEQRHWMSLVTVHDVRDLAFAVETRPGTDQLEPTPARDGLSGRCMRQSNPDAIELSTAAAIWWVPSALFMAKHFR